MSFRSSCTGGASSSAGAAGRAGPATAADFSAGCRRVSASDAAADDAAELGRPEWSTSPDKPSAASFRSVCVSRAPGASPLTAPTPDAVRLPTLDVDWASPEPAGAEMIFATLQCPKSPKARTVHLPARSVCGIFTVHLDK
jgi:hypothetical protein